MTSLDCVEAKPFAQVMQCVESQFAHPRPHGEHMDSFRKWPVLHMQVDAFGEACGS
jgi:hypothetical protein